MSLWLYDVLVGVGFRRTSCLVALISLQFNLSEFPSYASTTISCIWYQYDA